MSGALKGTEEPVEQEGQDSELRTARRQRVLKSARASFNDEFSAVSCVMRNVSETGAKLEFEEIVVLPRSFTLYVDLDGYKVQCERVWQDGRSCGVRFVGEKIAVKVFRTQLVRSSETALSERTVRDIAIREQREICDREQPRPEEAPPPANRRPVFGRRN